MYGKFTKEGLKSRIKFVKNCKKEVYAKDIQDIHVSISKGNSKMGYIPSISLVPVLNCGSYCHDCKYECYDLKNDLRHKNVIVSRWNNWRLYTEDRDRYFREIQAISSLTYAFRWHVGGEIQDIEYFKAMVGIAEVNKNTQYLVFTKNLEAVNAMLRFGELPSNLHVMASAWKKPLLNNHHHLPVFVPEFKDKNGVVSCAYTPTNMCSGNCTQCLLERRGCWYAKKGDVISVKAH